MPSYLDPVQRNIVNFQIIPIIMQKQIEVANPGIIEIEIADQM